VAIDPLLRLFGKSQRTDFSTQEVGDTSRNFIEQVVGVAPIAVGVGVGVAALKSNTPGSLLGLKTHGFRDSNASIGNSLKRARAAREEINQVKFQKFAEDLINPSKDSITRMLGEGVESRNAILSTIVEAVDDATSGISTAKAQDIKSKLIELMRNGEAQLTEDAAKIVQSTVNTVLESGTPEAQATFHRLLGRNQGMREQLQAPTYNLRGLNPNFTEFSGELSPKIAAWKGQFEKAMRGTGEVRIMQGQGDDLYAHIYNKGRNRSTFRASIPLSLNSPSGVPVFRVGAQSTAQYSADILFADATKLLNEFRKTGAPGAAVWDQNSIGRLKKAGAIGSVTDFFANDFLNRLKAVGGNASKINADTVGKFQRSFGTSQSRAVSIPGSSPMRGHLLAQQAISHSSMTIAGWDALDLKAQTELRKYFAYAEGGLFDIGGSHEVKRLPGGGSWTRIGLGANSPLSQITPLGLTDRGTLPATMRIRQVTGREGMFVQPANPVESTLGSSRTFQQFGQNVGWSNGLTGGMNKAIVMDLSGKNVFSLGPGEAWLGGKARVRQAIQKSVLDVAALDLPSTQLLNELLEGQTAWSSGAGKISVSGEKEIAKFFGKYGNTLSQIGQGAELAHYTGMQELNLAFESASNVMGTPRIHFGGSVVIDTSSAKAFSTLTKSFTKGMTPEMQREMLGRAGVLSEVQALGLGAEQTMLSGGGMLKKGSGAVARQMVTGMGLMAGYGTKDKTWNSLFNTINKDKDALPDAAYKGMSKVARDRAYLENMASLTLKKMLALPNAEARTGQMGMVMAGLYKHADLYGFGAKGEAQTAVANLIKGEAGPLAGKIIASAKRGTALGADTITPGPLSQILRSAESSIEPRYYQFLQHQVANLGMPANEANDFMAMVLARKRGAAEHLKIVQDLSKMQLTLSGREGVVAGYKASQKLTTIGVDAFLEGSRDTRAMTELLAQHKEGFILDLGGVRDKTGRAAEAALGTRQIRIAGGNTMALMRGVEIKTAEGPKPIHGEYTRKIHLLSDNLNTIRQSVDAGANADLLREWKAGISELFGNTYNSVLRGKLRGSSYGLGASLQIAGEFPTTELTKAQLSRTQLAFKRSSGSAVFADTQRFLDSMRGYMGGATASYEAVGMTGGKAKGAAMEEMGSRFQSYFLGMEARLTEGTETILGRDPVLGPGHVAPAQTFRYAPETGRADVMFGKFTRGTPEGKAALARFEAATGRRPSSFQEMRRMALPGTEKGLRRKAGGAMGDFFQSMARNISALAPTEGGGKVYIPNFEVDVHYNNRKKGIKLNLSFAAGMIGDFDGDNYQLFFPSAKKGTSGYFQKSSAAKEMFSNEALRYRAEVGAIMEEASEVIKKTAQMEVSALGELSPQEARYHEVMKEATAKDIGRIDVALNKLRLGTVQTSAEMGYSAAQQGLAGLTAIEEIVAIKAKHHAHYKNMAGDLIEATNEMIRTGGSEAGSLKYQKVLEDIFEGSAINTKEGLRITGFNKDMLAQQLGGLGGTGEEAKIMQQLNKSLLQEGRAVSVGSLVESGRMAARYVHETGAEFSGTAYQNAQMFKGEKAATRRAFALQVEQRHAMEAGLALETTTGLAGTMDEIAATTNRITSATQKLDKRFLGPVAAGVGITLALKGVMGSEGYSPTPMLSAGEVMDSGVATAIRRGELFAPREDNMPTPESLGGGPHNDMMHRPVNTGETYFSRQNAYQIRGEVPSTSGVRASMDFLAGIRGSGSIRINDTRRPLTPNYIDRLMGD